tara:strand:+ start:495 stop:617 length:123 start_codon:yes stop_codon:yes gene_type:complete
MSYIKVNLEKLWGEFNKLGNTELSVREIKKAPLGGAFEVF